jgi:hypothetical protein
MVISTNLMSSRRTLPWFAAVAHALIFLATFGTVYVQSHPLFDGSTKYLAEVLTVTDLPVSLVAFGMMWGGWWMRGYLVWLAGGSALWFLWSSLIRNVWENRNRTETKPPE